MFEKERDGALVDFGHTGGDGVAAKTMTGPLRNDAVGSKNSCGLSVIEFEEASEASTRFDRTGGTADLVCCCR